MKKEFSQKEFHSIPNHGVPVFAVDIYWGYFIGGLCHPLTMKSFGYKGILPPDSTLMPPPGFINTDGTLESYNNAKEILT